MSSKNSATNQFVIVVWRNKSGTIRRVKYWETIADNLHKAGWSLGWVKDELRHLIAVVWGNL